MHVGQDFKDAVTQYVSLFDEIAEVSKGLAVLRNKKDALGDIIVGHMKRGNMDKIELREQGGALVRKESKRKEALKKDHIMAELLSLTGNNVDRAEACMGGIMDRRGTEVKDTLTRTKK